jgi:hypothetical protein
MFSSSLQWNCCASVSSIHEGLFTHKVHILLSLERARLTISMFTAAMHTHLRHKHEYVALISDAIF